MPFIQYILPTLAGTAIGAGGWALRKIVKRQKEQEDEQKAIKDGMLALLHDRIFSIYASCHDRGCASIEEIRNVEYLYHPYHKLGGNGTGTELYERIKDMPCPSKAQEEEKS